MGRQNWTNEISACSLGLGSVAELQKKFVVELPDFDPLLRNRNRLATVPAREPVTEPIRSLRMLTLLGKAGIVDDPGLDRTVPLGFGMEYMPCGSFQANAVFFAIGG